MAEPLSRMARRGMYFEEFEMGQLAVSPGRTVTEADVVGFAGLTGDWNSIHSDAEYAAGTPFGERVAHGLLGLSIANALVVRMGFTEGTVLGFREILRWKFSLPIRIGDTLHARVAVTGLKAVPRLGGGLVTLDVEVLNQKGEAVQSGAWSVVMLGRPATRPV